MPSWRAAGAYMPVILARKGQGTGQRSLSFVLGNMLSAGGKHRSCCVDLDSCACRCIRMLPLARGGRHSYITPRTTPGRLCSRSHDLGGLLPPAGRRHRAADAQREVPAGALPVRVRLHVDAHSGPGGGGRQPPHARHPCAGDTHIMNAYYADQTKQACCLRHRQQAVGRDAPGRYLPAWHVLVRPTGSAAPACEWRYSPDPVPAPAKQHITALASTEPSPGS